MTVEDGNESEADTQREAYIQAHAYCSIWHTQWAKRINPLFLYLSLSLAVDEMKRDP